MKTLLCAVILVGCLGAGEGVNWEEFLGRHDLVWERLPANWKEGAHFGNAMVGSMWYREKNGITMQVFRADVQDHRDNKHGWTAYSRPRLKVGEFGLKPVGTITGGEWRLGLWNAEMTGTVKTDRGEIRMRHFVHAEEMAIVTEVWTSEGEAGCAWEWRPAKAETTRSGYPKNEKEVEGFAKKYGKVFAKGMKLNEPNPEGRQESDGEVKVWVQDLKYGGQYATAWVDATMGANHRMHVASIANSFPGATARTEAVKTVKDFVGKGVEAEAGTHREWWHRYYRQSFVSIPETRLETLYWDTIYRYGSMARVGRAFIDTSGLWFQGGGWCYVTTDFNIQTAHWGVYAANRVEQGGELMEALHRNREELARNVRPAEWQADSAYFSVAVAAADMIGPRDQDMRYWNLVGCLPWTLHNCWWQYRYTMDDAMLREKLYPLLRRSVNLYLHMLKEEGGKLRLPATYSPESGTWEDCNFDLGLLRWGCQTLLWSVERLKIDDPLKEKWKDVLARLVDFPADGHGYRLGSNQSSAANHRHGSHLLMIYPLYVVNMDQAGNEVVMRRSAARFNATPGLPAMVSTHGVPLAASVGDGEMALKALRKQREDLFPNGLWFSTPCVESSLSAANGLQTMLLQSWGETIRVFPAMPKEWRDAVFEDLRAEGAFLVSAVRKGGVTQWVRIKSLAGERCRVKTDLAGKVKVEGCEMKEVGAGVYELVLKKGEEAVMYGGEKRPMLKVEAVGAEEGKCRGFGVRRK